MTVAFDTPAVHAVIPAGADQRMVLMQGLPGAGKTTAARAWVADDPNRRTRVNRDDLRQTIFNRGGRLSIDEEDVVTAVETAITRNALAFGRSVVVDDTNLSPNVVAVWREIAREAEVPIVIVVLATDVEECVRRDRVRGEAGGRSVGADVIRKLAAAG